MDRVSLSLLILLMPILGNSSTTFSADERSQNESESRQSLDSMRPTQEVVDSILEHGSIPNFDVFNSHKPLEIEAVEISLEVELEVVNKDEKPNSIRVNDPSLNELIQEALKDKWVRREGVSDFSNDIALFGCGERRTITLHLKNNEKLSIGYGERGFSMGSYAYSHNRFESYMLAQILKDVLKKEADIDLPERLVKELSGVATIERQQKLYERMTQDKPDEAAEEERSFGC